MYTLLYQLESGTWEDRKQACEALGLTGNPNALKPLLRATEDPDVEVREAASKALGQLGAPGAAAELATLLPREPEPRVRIALIDTLGRLRDACAVPVLSELLTDLDVSIRFAACRALASIPDKAILPALRSALEDSGLMVRAEACRGLGRLGLPHAIRPLIESLGDAEPAVRNNALEALEQLGETRLVTAYEKAFFAEDRSAAAMQTLVRTGDLRLVSALIKRLDNARLSDAQRSDLLELLADLQIPSREIIASLLCVPHLKRFVPHHLEPAPRLRLMFAACRECHATYQVLRARTVIAVLDKSMRRDLQFANDTLRVSWLARQQLFDFDRVEIGRADEKWITRFCVDTGNDMDEFRTAKYRTMTCTVQPTALLHPNTLGILKRSFGRVEDQRD